jgi:NADP-dependent 3-hydroxy acid dehydrogenase YdfG
MSTDFLFDQVAIVTGASSGIGRATALALANEGACVALISRRESALQELAQEIGKLGRKTIILPADVTQREQVEVMTQEVLSKWGRVDILIANAGEYIRSPIVELDPADLQRSLDINYFGSVYCIKAALPHMLARKSGHIVAVTSMDGKIGLPPDAPYVSAKFAMTGFLEVLRQEVSDHGITVTNVLPGRVDTVMIEHLRFSWVSPKISPENVAQSIVSAIRKRKHIVIVPPQAKLLYYINVFAPRLSDKLSRFFRLEGWTEK